MNRTSRILTILCALVVVGIAPALLADEQCSLRSIAGDFGYTVTGVRNPLGPAASVGTVHFDRDGNLTGTQTLSINGTIAQGEVLTGTISVNPDCTGTSIIVVSNTPFPRTSHLDVVWVKSSTGFRLIFTDPGLVLTGEGDRIHHGND